VAQPRAEPLDGRDLWPAIARGAAPERAALAVGCERKEELRFAVTDGQHKLAVIAAKPAGAERRELHDLQQDPGEARDVLAERSAPWFQQDPRTALETWMRLARLPFTGED
jgi:hypothetical protein